MQVVELNLASRPFKNDTLPWVGFLAGLVLLGWASWWNVRTYVNHRALLDSLHESNSSMRDRFADLEQRDGEALRGIDSVDLSKLRLRSAKANEVIRWKSFSWTKLFNQLEQIQPWDVQMTSIHPVFRSLQKGERGSIEDLEQVPVSVEGVAKNLKEYFKFQRALIFDPHFDRVDPTNTSTNKNSGETVFRLRFLYDPRVVAEDEDATRVAEGQAEPGTEGAGSDVAVQETDPVAADRTAADRGPEQDGVEPVDDLAADDSLKRISRRGGGERAEEQPAEPTSEEER